MASPFFRLASPSREALAPFEPLLRRYALLLAEANAKARLTGPTSAEGLWEEHILDALVALPLLPREGAVVDVGTGGGLPGLAWALVRPGLTVTLVDSIAKKAVALEGIVKDLAITNAVVRSVRSEVVALERRETFLVATARAVASADVVAELLSPLVAPGGNLLAFKGPSAEEELRPGQGRWGELGLGEPEIFPYGLGGKSLCVVRWFKEAPCPGRFPRRAGMALKRPWWR